MEFTNLISVFDPCQLPASEKELTESDYGREKINSLYAHVQIKVTFNEKEENEKKKFLNLTLTLKTENQNRNSLVSYICTSRSDSRFCLMLEQHFQTCQN